VFIIHEYIIYYGLTTYLIFFQSACLTVDGHLDLSKLPQLAVLEFVVHYLHEELDISTSLFQDELNAEGIVLPNGITIEHFQQMKPANWRNASDNIKSARKQLVQTLSSASMSHPRQYELIIDWQKDCRKYNSGANIEAKNFEYNRSNNGNESLTLEAAWILRNIMHEHAIPLRQIPSLWSMFYFLLFRRPIADNQIAGETQLWNHIHRIHLVDQKMQSRHFQNDITQKTEHGFAKLWYMSSDGAKHHGSNRNVLHITCSTSDDPSKLVPAFRLLTCSNYTIKTSEFCAEKNVETMVNEFGVGPLIHFAGGTNDNANDAQKEILMTFDASKETLKKALTDDDLESAIYRNGEERLAANCGDDFHIVNLAVSAASLTAFGDTSRDNHSQIHHRQMLQSTYDLKKDNPRLAQWVIDDLLDGTGKKLTLKAWRERMQRWGVNQRAAAELIKQLSYTTLDGRNVMVEWALYYANTMPSDSFQKRVGNELAVWYQMPQMKLALYFESEIGSGFFEPVMKWHSRSGPIHAKPGFRMPEIFNLLLDFQIPWLNGAVDKPDEYLPDTFGYLQDNFEDDEYNFRRKWLIAGLAAMREKFIDISSRYLFKPPLIFLILSHRTQGKF